MRAWSTLTLAHDHCLSYFYCEDGSMWIGAGKPERGDVTMQHGNGNVQMEQWGNVLSFFMSKNLITWFKLQFHFLWGCQLFFCGDQWFLLLINFQNHSWTQWFPVSISHHECQFFYVTVWAWAWSRAWSWDSETILFRLSCVNNFFMI